MVVPPNHTEESVLAAINEGLDMLAKNFVFGYYDLEDIRQEGYLYCFEALAANKYDGVRSLSAFLYVHMKNQFINLLRNKNRRVTDAPCEACHIGAVHTTNANCKMYSEWKSRNDRKANLVTPSDISKVCDDGESNMRVDDSIVDNVDANIMKQKIDMGLDADLRSDYLKILAGLSIPKARRLKVLEAVKAILINQQEGEGASTDTAPLLLAKD